MHKAGHRPLKTRFSDGLRKSFFKMSLDKAGKKMYITLVVSEKTMICAISSAG